MYLIGGSFFNLTILHSIVYSTADGATWTVDLPEGNGSLRGLSKTTAALHTDGNFHMVTGFSETDGANQAWAYQYITPNLVNWSGVQGQNLGDFWKARTRHAMFELGGKMYIHGGRVDTGEPTQEVLGDCWSSPDGITWTQEPQVYPIGVDGSLFSAHEIVDFGGTLVLVGGADKDQVVHNSKVYHSVDGNTWTEVADVAGLARRHFTMTEMSGELFVVGGSNVSDPANKVMKSSDGIVWTKVVQLVPYLDRSNHTATVLNGQLHIISGGGSNGSVYRTADGATWEELTPNLGTGSRTNQSLVRTEGRIWLIGGNQSGVKKNDTWSSADGITWRLDNLSVKFDIRANHRSILFLGKIWVTGG